MVKILTLFQTKTAQKPSHPYLATSYQSAETIVSVILQIKPLLSGHLIKRPHRINEGSSIVFIPITRPPGIFKYT